MPALSRAGKQGALRRAVMALLVVGFLVPVGGEILGCPFCTALPLTLREQIDSSEATVIVRWMSGDEGDLDRQRPPSATFEIVRVLKGDYQPGDTLTIDRYQAGRRGDIFLMSSIRADELLRWDRSIPLTKAGEEYLRGLPPSSASTAERLRYAIPFLEASDDMVATDAFSVLGSSPFPDIVLVKDEFSVGRLREWVFGEAKLKGQLGVYGMLVGLCGDQADIAPLKKLILNTGGANEFRLGIAGVMGGFLLLAGSDGLDVLDQHFLMNRQSSDSDWAAVIEALRFMWEYGDGRIDKSRLKQSLRLILDTDRPELVIADLARWQDWSVTEKLLAWYEERAQNEKALKLPIARFMIVAAQTDRATLTPDNVAAIEAAAAFVDRLQKSDPATYKRATRSLIP